MKRISLLFIDEHRLLRDAWQEYFNTDKRFQVIAATGDLPTACDVIANKKPAVIICDINMIPANGTIRHFSLLSPGSKVLAVAFCCIPAYARKMTAEGALGYLTKNSSIEELAHAIIKVNKGNKYVCKEIRDAIEDFPDLSLRELEVARAVKEGLSSREIALKLAITLKTVEVHRYNILKKLNLKNRAELVVYVNRKGL